MPSYLWACTDPHPSPRPRPQGRLCPFVITPRCRTSKEIVNPVYSNDMVIDMQVPMPDMDMPDMPTSLSDLEKIIGDDKVPRKRQHEYCFAI